MLEMRMAQDLPGTGAKLNPYTERDKKGRGRKREIFCSAIWLNERGWKETILLDQLLFKSTSSRLYVNSCFEFDGVLLGFLYSPVGTCPLRSGLVFRAGKGERLMHRKNFSPTRFIISDRNGNVSIIFAIFLIPVVGAMGLAVDYGRAMHVQTDLQEIADTAAIAGARLPATSNQNRYEAANRFLNASH